MVFVFAAALYSVDGRASAPGKDIFEKAMTAMAMTPLLGVIIGYLFGSKEKITPGKKDEKPAGGAGQEKQKDHGDLCAQRGRTTLST